MGPYLEAVLSGATLREQLLQTSLFGNDGVAKCSTHLVAQRAGEIFELLLLSLLGEKARLVPQSPNKAIIPDILHEGKYIEVKASHHRTSYKFRSGQLAHYRSLANEAGVLVAFCRYRFTGPLTGKPEHDVIRIIALNVEEILLVDFSVLWRHILSCPGTRKREAGPFSGTLITHRDISTLGAGLPDPENYSQRRHRRRIFVPGMDEFFREVWVHTLLRRPTAPQQLLGEDHIEDVPF